MYYLYPTFLKESKKVQNCLEHFQILTPNYFQPTYMHIDKNAQGCGFKAEKLATEINVKFFAFEKLTIILEDSKLV